MPRTPRNSPNPTGRPPSKAAEAAARVAIVSGGGAEAAALDTPGASRSATYRAVERLTGKAGAAKLQRPAKGPAPSVEAPAPQAPPGGAHGGALAVARPSTLSPPGGWPRDRLEQIHRLVLARWQPGALATESDPARAEEGWGPRTGAALAAELGLDADGLRGLLLEVEALEVAGRLPPELARAQSLAVYTACEVEARAAGDLGATLAARRRIDALRGIEGKAADATAAKQALEALARAVVALPREMAVGALRAAVGGLGEDAAEALKVAVRAAQGSASGGSVS